MATADDAHSKTRCPLEDHLHRWNANSGRWHFRRQRVPFNLARGCCCSCNRSQSSTGRSSRCLAGSRLRRGFDCTNDPRHRTWIGYGGYTIGRHGGEPRQSRVKPERWMGRRRWTRPARWSMACWGSTTDCTVADCKRHHDRAGFCSMAAKPRPIPCGLHR